MEIESVDEGQNGRREREGCEEENKGGNFEHSRNLTNGME